MPHRFHKGELSASHAIRRLLEIGITGTKEILWVLECGRTNNWPPLLEFFCRRRIQFPAMLPWGVTPTTNLVRVVRQQWRVGYKPKPRRQRGLDPLPKLKRAGRPKLSKSVKIRRLLDEGKSTAEIRRLLSVTSGHVRVIRHRSK